MQELLKKLRLSTDDKLTVINRPDETYFAGMIQSETLDKPTQYIVVFVSEISELTTKVMEIVDKDLLLPG